MTQPRVPGLDWLSVPAGAAGPEWHLVREGQVIAVITQPVRDGMFIAAYLNEARQYVMLRAAKFWLRGQVARAVRQHGSIEQAEAAYLKDELALARRRVLVSSGPMGEFLFQAVREAKKGRRRK